VAKKNLEKAKISQKYHSILQRYHYRPAALTNRHKFQKPICNLSQLIILRKFKYTIWTSLDYLTCNLTVHILSKFYPVHSAMKKMCTTYLCTIYFSCYFVFFTPSSTPPHPSKTPNTHCKVLLISALFWVLIFSKKL